MTNMKFRLGLYVVVLTLLTGNRAVEAEPIQPQHILIHMKTSLSEDDAQICAVPNVAWAMMNAGHQVTILVDASAVTSVTKGFGWFGRLVHSDTTALDRARLPERERVNLADQMGASLEEIPHQYGEYLGFLKKMGVTIYGNQTMMLLYNIDLDDVASEVTPIALNRMVKLFQSADRIIVY
ncbi:hypothetical protein [Candidatus Nitrospira allomarina]|uniref:DsrE/DsrF-like family protein n=1 Tax=Candidatus Nitrospira allomarina TaxID=3020900 RepID=A0AA96GEV3_9BACT|nr:hypothetical protein [Candidatus Nitrospira allomarina]WNM57588.1 hypothetical protein PP769_16700 [Candidatus Nitrospira allomarina]